MAQAADTLHNTLPVFRATFSGASRSRMRPFGNALRATISPDLGVDLGTANTVIYERGSGVVVSEPSVVAYDIATDRLLAVGREAKEMEGRTPSSIRVVHPLRRGTISDFHAAQALVETLVNRVLTTRPRWTQRLITCIPGCATDIECKAVEQAMRAAGARYNTYIPQAVAAAVGAGLDITTRNASMLVDIGGGTTEIAVLGFTGVIVLRSLQIGGDALDDAIQHKLAIDRFLIGPLSAERLKIALGYIGRPQGRPSVRIAGADLHAGAPRAREVSETFVGEAMKEGLEDILQGVWSVLESTPPETAGDLIDSGITLTGGGALIAGLAQEISIRTGIPTTVAPDPLDCVARGAGEILGSPTLLERLRPQAVKLTRWYQSLRIGMRESYSP
jgi:rod shape-determining protein MreB